MDDKYTSQHPVCQDRWVDLWLGRKHGGTFLDVGCGHHKQISNTCFLEQCRGWRGVAIDANPAFESGWLQERPSSRFICTDATAIDYAALLNLHQMPERIDYLSMDLEPPTLTLLALEKVLQSGRRFTCITYETDWYREKSTREPSRKMLSDLGYRLEIPGDQDDFWVDGTI